MRSAYRERKMMRHFAFVALLSLSTLTMGAGEPGGEVGKQGSSSHEDQAQHLNDRGVVLLGAGRLDDAIELFTQAIAHNPRLVFAYYNRANAYLLRKDPQRAADDYSDAIQLSPDFALAYMNRGIVHSMQNELEDALTDFNKAVELAPRHLDGYYNRAMVFTKLGRLLEAIGDYTAAIQLNARDAELYVARAHVWETLKEVDKAVADYDSALAIDPGNQKALWHLKRLSAQKPL